MEVIKDLQYKEERYELELRQMMVKARKRQSERETRAREAAEREERRLCLSFLLHSIRNKRSCTHYCSN